ncbi:helix-turn-helix domain-containing protein [Geodermatophilus sp. SYSU D01119]
MLGVHLVEVLRRHSNNYGAVQRVGRLERHLTKRPAAGLSATPRPAHLPSKLSHRLSDETVAAIVDAYQAGATTREVGERYNLAHSSVNKLLKRNGVATRRRSPGDADRARAVALYAAGKSTRQIGAELELGASTVQRVLHSEGVQLWPRFSNRP